MSRNLLTDKREKVQRLELALTKAREAKQRADLALTTKLAQIADSKPKLGEGVIARFEVGGERTRPKWPTVMVSNSRSGLLVEVPRDESEAGAEKERARIAHSAFCEANQDLSIAKADLLNFENQLRNLRSKIECFGDL